MASWIDPVSLRTIAVNTGASGLAGVTEAVSGVASTTLELDEVPMGFVADARN